MLTTSKRFDADVVVCGGGPAGTAAGISAARSGKRVILLEMRESLGGLCTNGYITGLAGVVDGISKEWLERLEAEGHAVMRPHLPTAEPEYGKAMLEQMLLQSGCRVLYGAHVADCEVEDGKITRVIVYCKAGKVEVTGKVFIDCTGDADLAFAAGVPCDVGNAEFCGLSQSVTMGFRLSYVNLAAYNAVARVWEESEKSKRIEQRKRYILGSELKAIENGDQHEILSPGNLIYPMPVGTQECTDVTIDATHTFDCHCDDLSDLTRQIVDQHRKVIWFVEFLRKYIAGFENCVLESFAPMNGVRDSRRVVGEYIMTAADIAAARKFPDGVVQHTEFFDAHIPTPGFHTASRHVHLPEPVEPAICRPSQDDGDYMHHPFVAMGGWEVRTNIREYSEIPYRSLIASGIDNLLCAGRCASADYHAIGSIRVIANSMGMGMAAGIGAAMTAEKGIPCRELDGALVRAEMIRRGVGLDRLPDGYWKTLREAEGEYVVSHNDTATIITPDGRDVCTF